MMDSYSDQGCNGIELLDLLFDQNDGILRHEEVEHHGNHAWPMQESNRLCPAKGREDFLNALLSGSDSILGSPLWSPSASDSGISEDPQSDQMDSPPRPDSPPADPQFVHTQLNPAVNVADPDFPDLNGWASGFLPGKTVGTHCDATLHTGQLSSGFSLTVKDLLLSGVPEPPPQQSQSAVQELTLNDDEKKLLAKEGVALPSQLPLTKYEERILKKIRRKIRNKQSAQESRKKKKEYIDGLEIRMAACSAHNQELQKKVFHLEKCNTSLIEQLRHLQGLLMNGSNKTAQTGTCILVLVLSLSLILFPSLKPLSESKVNPKGDFGLVRVQSRSLHNLESSRVVYVTEHPYSAAEEPGTFRGFSRDKGMEELTSQLGKVHVGHGLSDVDPVPHNTSLDEQHHHHGDPITGHVATVTLNPQGSKLRPHADDM